MLLLLLKALLFLFPPQDSAPAASLHYSFNHRKGAVVEEKRSGTFDTVQYVFTRALYKPNSDPLWRANGIEQECLLFDGYSTYIEKQEFSPAREFTLSVWVAPRAFEWGDEGKLSAIINQQDLPAKRGFALGMFRHGSWSFQFGDGRQWVELWDEGNTLPRNSWSFLTATLSETGASLYLNGRKISEKRFDSLFTLLPAADEPLLIGRHNQAVELGRNPPFKLNMFNGLMDELHMQEGVLQEREVKALFEAYLPSGNIPAISFSDIALDFTKYEGDRFRPGYHAIAPAHWMNEPHAPFYFQGKYHLFYQHNPTGPYWHQIHWGHWVSEDMINWQHAPIALAPEKGDLTPDGVWSGAAHYDAKGEPLLFFTAGNDSKTPNQAVGIARPANISDPNLKEWVYHPELVAEQPEGYLFNEFRDPFVWKEAETWYMLVGTGLENRGGTAALFTSRDALNWEYRNPFYISDFSKYPQLGLVWELPVVLPLGTYPSGETRYILLISPVRDPAIVEVYYWLGRFDKHSLSFVPDQAEPQLMDYGRFGFTGPSGMIDPKTGRAIVFTIAQGKHRGLNVYEMGWAHNAGLPVALRLDDSGDLRFEPIEEIESRRGKKLLSLTNQSLQAANKALQAVKGDQLEIQLRFASSSRNPHGLLVRKSDKGEEQTRLYYNPRDNTFGIDRRQTTRYQHNGLDEGPLDLGDTPFALRVFLDKSMLEAYANQRKSITSRTYCSLEDALGIALFGDKGLKIESLEVWEMEPIPWSYTD
jgi:beta-fructofuranosidase